MKRLLLDKRFSWVDLLVIFTLSTIIEVVFFS